jgi:D-3-phosphoglycerate dehydrogenase / 2-oxoglutarate reductase
MMHLLFGGLLMYRIKTLNRIAEIGLEAFKDGPFELVDEGEVAEGILVRSADMHSLSIPPEVLAVARAGAGVNNIPIDTLSSQGVVVFNTPGANANGVKELTLTALLLSCRKVVDGIAWAQTQGADIEKLVEKEKNRFIGPELQGKRLGVIGLGAIGVMVANAAVALGMEVSGCDPYISVEAAWGLSSQVRRARTQEGLVAESDFITIHVPLMDNTRNFYDDKLFAVTKKGARLVNLARNGLVDNKALLKAISGGVIEKYVTDFPEADLLGNDKIILIPHLGASTPEAEDNCAVMACRQLAAYLDRGAIVNSVNYPTCDVEAPRGVRLCIMNRNVPAMIGKITAVLAERSINIREMVNKNKGDFAYNVIDLDSDIVDADLERIRRIDGVIRVRKIQAY